MGCAGSKQAIRDRRGSPSPYNRSQSMPLRHFGLSRKVGNSCRHVVALTSSTLGSLRLDSDSGISEDEIMMKSNNDDSCVVDTKDIVDKAKAWSHMIESKMPKTIIESPPTEELLPKTIIESPPTEELETINTWELMEGLEDPVTSPKPQWMQIAPGETIVTDFDPDVISNFRKALDELSPQHRSILRSPEPEMETAKVVAPTVIEPIKYTGIVKARVSAFQEKIDAKRTKKCPPNGERKVVYYFTSLRGVRKTYENCWAVRVILQGYGVRVDERDVSMHGGFKDELNAILGMGFGGSRLPRVFSDGKYLGGADEVRQMHEDGALARALEECEAAVVGKGAGACETCGDMRFVPCEVCSGSCKVFVEAEYGEGGGIGSGFRRCAECNENGLVRCPICC